MKSETMFDWFRFEWIKRKRSISHHPTLLFASILVGALLTLSYHYNGIRFHAYMLVQPRNAFEESYSHVLVRDCLPRLPTSTGRGTITRTQVGEKDLFYYTLTPPLRKPWNRVPFLEPVKIMAAFKRPAVMLDVGANAGRIAFPVLMMKQGHSVIAVEPVRGTVNKLCRTANLNGLNHHPRLMLVHAALSSKDSEMNIYIPSSRDDNAAISKSASTRNVGGKAHREIIRTIAGDRFLAMGNIRPDVIKVDTQGHELEVLKGLKEYLRSARPLVIAESDPNLMRDSGVNPVDIYKLMVKELGYTAYFSVNVVDRDGVLRVNGKVMGESVYPTMSLRDIFYWKN